MTAGNSFESLSASLTMIKTGATPRRDNGCVGELVTIAAERGRATRPDLKLGVCGEHGGDPASIAFCELAGLDYI
jgi:phosphoenolpyruvate synthase/pyruvate phosphate dikinase